MESICRYKTYHSVADVPKKVEKTSSENSTLTIFEHPYRTCGSGGSCGRWLLWLLWLLWLQILQTLCSHLGYTSYKVHKPYVHI